MKSSLVSLIPPSINKRHQCPEVITLFSVYTAKHGGAENAGVKNVGVECALTNIPHSCIQILQKKF